jgi:hypothetical protein
MNKSDGITLASAAAALLMSSAMLSAPAAADEASPVKVTQCQGLVQSSSEAIVGISSGHEMLSKSLCERLGGTQVGSLALAPAAQISPAESEQATEIAYCNDLFTCSGFSACKGNGNANCAGKNSCHGIGFVGISSSDLKLSQQLCEKLGGAVLSSL